MQPWTCPKCGRVWSGLVTQCVPCNQRVTGKLTVPFPTYPPKVSPNQCH